MPFGALLRAFLLFSALFLVVLVLLVSYIFVSMLVASRKESCEDEDRNTRASVEDSEQLLYGFKASIFLDHTLS